MAAKSRAQIYQQILESLLELKALENKCNTDSVVLRRQLYYQYQLVILKKPFKQVECEASPQESPQFDFRQGFLSFNVDLRSSRNHTRVHTNIHTDK